MSPRLLFVAASRMARRQKGPAAIVVLAGFVFAFTTITLVSARTAAVTASESGVVSERGYAKGWAIQANTTDAALSLSGIEGLVEIATANDLVSTDAGATPARLTAMSDTQPAIGALISGSRPQTSAEVSISRTVATALKIDIGDSLAVASNPSQDYTVTGVVVNPGDPDDPYVVVIGDAADFGLETSIWLAEGDFSRYPELNDLGVEIIATSTTGTMAELALDPPGAVRLLQQLPPLTAVVTLLAASGLVASLRRNAERTARTIIAAGASNVVAWRIVRSAGVIAWTTGAAIGTVLALGAIRAVRLPAAAALDQYWVETPINLPWTIGVLLSGLLASAVASQMLPHAQRAVANIQRRHVDTQVATGWVLPFLLVAVGIVPMIVTAVRSENGGRYAGAVIGGLLVLSGIAIATIRFMGLRSTTALATARHALARQNQIVGLLAVGVVTISAMYSAVGVSDTSAVSSIPGPQPDGSLLVEAVGEDQAQQIIQTYRSLGGTDVGQYVLLDSQESNVRVTSAEFAQCANGEDPAQTAIGECLEATSAELLVVSVEVGDAATDSAPIRATASLNNDTAVVDIRSGESRINYLGSIDAVVDDRLGGNLPGLVVDSATAEQFGIIIPAGASQRLALFDYVDLDSEERAIMRREINVLAPGGLVSTTEATDSFTERLSLEFVVATIGGLLGAVLLLGSAFSTAVAARRFRRTLTELGASWSRRCLVGARTVLPTVLSSVGIFAAIPILLRTSGRPVWSGGSLWLIGPGLLMSTCLVAAFTFALIPSSPNTRD